MVTPGPTFYRCSLAVEYDSVLFPFELLLFLRSLAQRGYLIPEPLALEILAPPPGARLEGGKLIARKADILVALNTERKTMAVNAAGPEAAADEIETLEALVRDELGIDASQSARFYELSTALTVTSTANPLQSWDASLRGVPIVSRISDIIGAEIAPFGLRFVGRDQQPGDSEWLDVRIEPRTHAPTTHHFADIVFRHPDRTRVMEFARNLEQTVRAIVALLEEDSAP